MPPWVAPPAHRPWSRGSAPPRRVPPPASGRFPLETAPLPSAPRRGRRWARPHRPYPRQNQAPPRQSLAALPPCWQCPRCPPPLPAGWPRHSLRQRYPYFEVPAWAKTSCQRIWPAPPRLRRAAPSGWRGRGAFAAAPCKRHRESLAAVSGAAPPPGTKSPDPPPGRLPAVPGKRGIGAGGRRAAPPLPRCFRHPNGR